ncbi:phosphoglycerol geranylgeranyltransferase [Lacinutrix salivirga]
MKTQKNILSSISNGKRNLAVLLDPDKFNLKNTSQFIDKVNKSVASHLFVGGSIVDEFLTDALVKELKKHTQLPIVLFPGDVTQITEKADALLFLSLLSGRNPDYLIGKHVEAISKLRTTNLEVIPTGYILIESGKETAVQQVTNTQPLSRNAIQKTKDTAKAGELLGMKLIYLEAGSGAKLPLAKDMISQVKEELNIPLIVGGGIKNKLQIEEAYKAGADLIVIGTAFEENESFLDALKKENQ